jgi:hypothetical protein
LLFQLPRECRVYTALDPSAQWGWSEIFANKTNYLLELLVWQNGTPSTKGKLAAHKRKQPKPFMPDFMKPKQSSEISKEADDTMTVDDVKSWLSVPRGV